MASESVVQRVLCFNAGRDPELVQRKYHLMRASPFVFLRGTCHLFADDWPRDAELNAAPLTWCCGDLHLENFGAYKGDNRLDYYDVNDFDEATLAPCTIDVARFLTSLSLAAHGLGVTHRSTRTLQQGFLRAYAEALGDGKARWIERETAVGLVQDLLVGLRTRKRKDLLKKHTMRRGARRGLRADGKRALPVATTTRQSVVRFMRRVAAAQPDPASFRVLDVARRIAGTGSLGIRGYVILVEGKGSPDRNWLIGLKAAAPSVWQRRLAVPQPAWRSEAARVVGVQQRAQAVSPAMLQAVRIGRTPFVLRELQPAEDRVSLRHWRKFEHLERVMTTMAQVVAWMHLRSSGRQGAAVADALIDFAHQPGWRRHVLEWAETYAQQARRDWRDFSAAMDAGGGQ